jgi:hypothetical protein
MIKEGNFFLVPNTVIAKHGRTLGPVGIAVYCCLAYHAKEGAAFPTHQIIAEELGGLHPSTVRKAISKLVNCQEVIRQPRFAKGGRQTSNLFVINGHANLYGLQEVLA